MKVFWILTANKDQNATSTLTDQSRFFYIIKPRNKEHLPNQYIIYFEPVFILSVNNYSFNCYVLLDH